MGGGELRGGSGVPPGVVGGSSKLPNTTWRWLTSRAAANKSGQLLQHIVPRWKSHVKMPESMSSDCRAQIGPIQET